MRSIFFILIFGLFITIFPFGKNKVQYHNFDWKTIETQHFIIYYYDGGKFLAEYCALTAEESYKHIRNDFLYELKERISIILYNSHNHFQETNTSAAIPEESVGGYTEFMKNRVVLPYPGNWEGFRHVIHHELTHAVMNQMLFGSNLSAIAGGIQGLNMPLWLIEGIAEFQSRGGWENEGDIYIRDGLYYNYLPPIQYLSGYFIYKGGQNILYFISQKYGSKKIGDIFRNLSVFSTTESAFKKAIGLNYSELNNAWKKWLNEKYVPGFLGKDEQEDIAQRMTDHLAYHNFVNVSPAISPDGKTIAFLSNKSDYFDIYLIRTFDGQIIKKIVAGQTTVDFEEFHWLTPGMAFSPDSKKIVFSAKKGGGDALYIYDALEGEEVLSKEFELDAVLTPDWSSDNKICFVGVKDGFSNIYLYDPTTDKLSQITHDIYSIMNPKFSPDGTKIAYASDRKNDLENTILSVTELMKINTRDYDIFYYDLADNKNVKVTNDQYQESYPFWENDQTIGYISNKSGINNIYKINLKNKQTEALTNLINGLIQTSFNDNKLAYTAFNKAGYDIFLIEDFDKLKAKDLKTNVRWYQEVDFSKAKNFDFSKKSAGMTNGLKNFVFARDIVYDGKQKENQEDSVMTIAGYKNFDPKVYKPFFSADIIAINAGYSNFGGWAGTTYIQLSDQLSDHNLNIGLNLSQDIWNSDISIFYHFLAYRLNYGIGLIHSTNYYSRKYYINNQLKRKYYRDRNLGLILRASYPFSRFSRVDGYFSLKHIVQEKDLDKKKPDFEYLSSSTISEVNFGYSYDNVIWGIVGPENGTRFRTGISYIPNLNNLVAGKIHESTSLRIDYRKYFRLVGAYQFAFRFAGGLSEGLTPQIFYVGGVHNWLGASVNYDNELDIFNNIEKYYSYYNAPLRGRRIYERDGNRFALVNAEFRYPFIERLSLGFPIPITIGYIRGVTFMDLGSAWHNEDFRGTIKENNHRRLNDLLFSFGFGTRINLGSLILRYDTAWNYDFFNNPSKAKHIFSLGGNF